MLANPTLSVESTSGETHRRHHVSADGFYRGRQVMPDKSKTLPEKWIAVPSGQRSFAVGLSQDLGVSLHGLQITQ